MEILLVLIPLSALVVVAAVVMFFRAVDSGQFDDLERQGRTALFDEPGDRAASTKKPIETD
jgi:cbb3-type cytochrome oxidase maturation protein